MLTFIVFIIILGLLIFVHEFGHFIVARWCGVEVKEFAFGFPPTIWKKEYKGTVYKINSIPIGGYVKMLGEDEEVKNPHSFSSQKGRKKMAIVVAGVLMNLLVAYLFFVIGYLIGMSPVALDANTLGGEHTNQVVISSVDENSPATDAGLKSGDLINGFASAEEFSAWTTANRGSTQTISVSSGQATKDVSINLRENPDELALGVAIGGQGTEVKLGLGEALVAGAREVGAFTALTGKFLWNVISNVFGHARLPEEAKDVSGPLGIYNFTGQAVKLGVVYIIQWIAILSLNFALLNILPFPALDGGRAVFIALDGIVRRKVVRDEIEGIIHMVGFVLLIALMVAITYKEVVAMIGQ